MDGLRWLLLLFGLLVVAGVYWYSRKERDKPGESESAQQPAVSSDREEPIPGDSRQTPSIGIVPDESVDDSFDEPEPPQQRIITVRIVASKTDAFSGEELILSLRGIGLRHGKFGIFHRYEGSEENQIVFSAASLVEPGSFDLENIQSQQIPGISLFLVLPGAIEGPLAFDSMMAAARELTKALHAELLDESGSTLSIQRERYLREEIIQHELGMQGS
jgi:cell division protein ZipA